MSDITKALDILTSRTDTNKQFLYVGEVLTKTSEETTVSIGEDEVEAADFVGVSVGDTVAVIYQNRMFYILGKKS